MNFKAFILLEAKRFFCIKNLLIFLLILLISFYSVHRGIKDYKDTLSESKNFQKLQALMFSTLLNYDDYTDLGINVFYVPSASSIFFTSPAVLSELSAKVSSIETFDIYNNCHGKGVIKQNYLFNLRFSVIVLLLGSLLALFMGLEPIRCKEYSKCLSSICSPKTVYLSVISSRFILLILSFLILIGTLVCMVTIENVELTKTDFEGLAWYIVSTILMLLFFFISGSIIASIRSNGMVIITSMIVWFSFVFLIPVIINSTIDEKSDDISSTYKLINHKLKIISDFEKRTDKKYGKFNKDNMDVEREIVEGYFNNDFKKLEDSEEQYKNEIKKVIRNNNNLSLFTPTTFFNFTSFEISSRGYMNYLNFYGYLQKTWRNFTRFWIDRVFYNDPKELVSFIKGDENLFYAKSQLPDNFGKGVLINMAYIIGLFFVSYFMFKKSLLPHSKKSNDFKEIRLPLFEDDKITITTYEQEPADQVINVFFGKIKYFKGEITIEEENIVTKTKKEFLYIPHPDDIPEDIKTLDLLVLFKRLLKLTDDEFQELKNVAGSNLKNKRFCEHKPLEKAIILLSLVNLGKGHTYILKDFTAGLHENDRRILEEIIEKPVEKNRLIIDINTKGFLWLLSASIVTIQKKDSKYILTKQNIDR